MEIKEGDFVLVFNEDRAKKLVGKITQIKVIYFKLKFEQDDKVIIFTIYALPDDLPGKTLKLNFIEGRKQYHSKFELIRTDETAKEFKSNVIKKVEVVRLLDFKQKFKHPNMDFPSIKLMTNERLDEVDLFFFRQRYSRATGNSSQGNYAPELKPSCICKKILNPDEDTLLCENCNSFMHPICLRQIADNRCPECRTEIPLKFINNLKRAAPEQEEDKGFGEQDYRPLKRQKVEGNEEISSLEKKQEVSPFPSLKDFQRAKQLEETINSLKFKSDSYNKLHDIDGENKTRKNVRENFIYVLILGIEEARERNELDKINGLDANSSDDQV